MSATSPISKPSIVEEKQKFLREQIHSRMNQRDMEWKQEVDQLRKQFFSDSSGVGLFNERSNSSSNNFEISNIYNSIDDRKKAPYGNVRESVYSPYSTGSLFTPPLSPDFYQQPQQQQNSLSPEHLQQQHYQQSQHQHYHSQPQHSQEQQYLSPKVLSTHVNNFSNIADTKLRSNVISPTNIIPNASIASSSSSSSSSSSTSSASSLSPTLLKHEFDVKNFLPEEIKVTTERGKLIVCASHKETGLNKSVSREFKRIVDLQNHLDTSQLLCTLTKDGKLVVEIDRNPSSTKPCIAVAEVETSRSTSSATKTFTPSIVDKYFNKDSTFVSTRFKPIETYSDKPLVQIPRQPLKESYHQPRQMLLQQCYSSDVITPTNSDFSSTASSFQFVSSSNDNVKNTAKDYLDGGPYSSHLKKVSLPDLVDDTNHYSINRKSNENTHIEDCKYHECGDLSNIIESCVSDVGSHNSVHQTHPIQENNHYNYSSSPLDNLENFSTILKLSEDRNMASDAGVTVIHSTNRPFHVGLNVGADVDPNDLKIDAVDRILLVRITNNVNNYTNSRSSDKLNQSTRMWKIYLPDDLDPVNMNAHLTDEGELLLEESC